ncbi:ATP-binding cassette domain-containing protein [Legionella sp. PATHC035]|uniref:amino acid ABC transporter ATP-binding protein n=1 Tax=Legionella sp. PATHC035 TaxID=2992040 RepID=UPI0022430EE2|nr:ATP-binding cassette domain-containing protein [Legionella sp. PATHC035]MCW8410433.1 ATP-binding cassette domain-containing protein [Legionella sp. PATHC035]
MLVIDQASKYFGCLPVLNSINLELKAHTVLGLAGPSGSGKSTLLRCIQQLETLDSGTITVEGQSGFMFQDFQLFPHMTVMQNLVYAPRLQDKTLNHEVQAHSLLQSLGISDKAAAYPHQLSGGQKQRVALARSLMMNPSLLLCDEPTSGLDLATIDEVINLLNSVKSLGVTMVIASHDLDFLSKMSDRLIVLKGGQIVADVVPKELAEPILHLKQYYQE